MHRVTLLQGDGIGPEVTAAARAILDAAGGKVEWEDIPMGQRGEREFGAVLPEAAFQSSINNRVCLKGPVQTPFGVPYPVVRTVDGEQHVYPSITIALRRELKMYAAVRPLRSWPGVESRYGDVDIVVFRENSEDLYIGKERMVDADTAEALKITTRGACRRMAKFSAEYMQRTGRKRVTVGHKSNVLKLTDGMFLHESLETLKAYPQIEADSRVIDAMCMELVTKPHSFDCLLLSNLYGDIVSDLGAGLVGGLGIAPGANIGEECAMFEAVHGSAPDIAGKDIANPLSMVLSAVMMLRFLGEADAAARIDTAIEAVLREKQYVTRDLGGNAGTQRMTQAIVDKLR